MRWTYYLISSEAHKESQSMPPTTPVAERGRGTYLMFVAAPILLVTMGARQSLGLFVAPINTATGLGIVAISFALAVGQFVWGLAQPIFGGIADRYGSGVVLVGGALMLAAGAILTTVVSSGPGLSGCMSGSVF